MDSYNDHQGSWFLLPVFLERYILSQHLQVLAIEVRLDYLTQCSAIVDWTALDHLNDILDDERFESLENVDFRILLNEEACWDPTAEMAMLLRAVERRLYNPVAVGKLSTSYCRAHRVRYQVTSLMHLLNANCSTSATWLHRCSP